MSASPLSTTIRFTVGRFARLTRLSARTLRKYDAAGLLTPATVDPDTGYRYYSLSQVPRAETIRLLRSLDVPLREIAAILDSDEPQAAKRLLEHQLARVKDRIARDRHTVLRLESAVARGGALGAYECVLRDVPPQAVIALKIEASRAAIDPAIVAARDALLDWAADRRATVVGREIVEFDFDPFDEDDLAGDVCLPVAAPVDDDGDVRGRTLPACTGAFTVHRGSDEDLHAAYCSLLGWIIERDLRIVGHERELYLVDERDTDDPREFVTEIMWPVETAGG
jgi:DNA-binding transcriptional MerR regulator